MSNVQRRDSSIQQDKRLGDRVYDLELWRLNGGGGVGGGGTGPAGPPGLTWQGAWVAANPYAVNDAVTYLGSSYRRKIAGTTATSPPLDAVNWEVIALKGTDGVAASVPIEAWHTVGDPGEPAFQNGWVNYGSGYGPLQFSKDPLGKVHLRGAIKSGPTGTVAFTLPVGYRPPAGTIATFMAYASATAYAVFDCRPDGSVMVHYRNDFCDSSVVEFDTGLVTTMPTGPKGDKGDPGAAPALLEPWHSIGAAGEPAFANNWTNFDVTRVAKFRKFPDGKVKPTGVIKLASGATMFPFTLPAGYRPVQAGGINFITSCSGGTATITVEATGTLQIAANGGSSPGTFCFLDGIEFDTESVNNIVSSAAIPIESFHTVGAVGEPSFMGAWTAEPGYNVRFRRDPFGKVRISGVANPPASGSDNMFTLPLGYRPVGNDRAFPCQTNTGTAIVWVGTDGIVHGPVGAFSYVYLDVIEFDSESISTFVVGAVGREDIEFTNSSNVVIPVYANDKLLRLEFEFVTSTYAASVYLRPNGDATARMATYLGQQTSDLGGGSGSVTALANAQARAGLVLTFNIGAIGQLRSLGNAEINLRDSTLPRMWKADFTYANTLGSSNHNQTELKTTYRLPANTPATPITTLNIVPDTGTITGLVRVRR